MPARPRPVLAMSVIAGSLLVAACSGSSPTAEPAASPSLSSTPVASPSVSPSTSPSAPTPTLDASAAATPNGLPADASPLSGRAAGQGKQVLIVKIDNTPRAWPHAGLKSADVVYVEEVEYGITRLAAVFATDLPDVVGPIRSARITDLELFANYGNAAFAYSGARSRLRPVIAASDLVDVSGDLGPRGYYRDRSRRAPDNFMGRPEELLRRAGDSARVRDIGFVFSTTEPSGGRPASTVTARWPATRLAATYDADRGGYSIAYDGTPARAAEGGSQLATTVVVQYVKVSDSGYGDRYGGRTPMSDTVGRGDVVVLRGGRAYDGTWSRPKASAPTAFTGSDGRPLAFAPGQVWVLLVNRARPVALS